MVAAIPALFLVTHIGCATAGVDLSKHSARVVRHDNIGSSSTKPAGLVSTAVGSMATSLLPLKEYAVLRRADDKKQAHAQDDASSQARSSLSQTEDAPADAAKSKQAALAKKVADAKEVKMWEDNVKQAEAKLALARKKLNGEVHKQLIQKLRKHPPRPLPAGWKSTKDPKSGKLYYYKKETASEKGGKPTFKVQWERPAAPQASGLAKTGQANTDLAHHEEPDDGEDPDDAPDHGHLPPSLSAFEEDHYNGLSEYFGPFRLDYADHSIVLPDWNMVIESPEQIPGHGNMIIGNDNYAADADNAFITGEHNTGRGFAVTAAGGKDNVAEGNGVTVIGGEQNVARGNFSVVNGGYRNEVDGSYSVVGGGVKNVALGNFATATGGQANLAEGLYSVATGGKSNEALGRLSAVHGGSGNKAEGNSSVVDGGLGQTAYGEGDSVFSELTQQDLESLASADHVGNPFER